MRIAFLLQEPGLDANTPSISPVTREVIARLVEKGARVDTIIPEDHPIDVADLQPLYDLYVLKSKTPLTLSLAGALTTAGASIVNTFESSNLTRDKIATTAVLANAGVPVPPSWAAGRADLFQPLLNGEGALWIKPQRGSRGKDIRRVESADELDLEAPRDPYGLPLPLFAQREAPSEGYDLKVFVIGDRAWALRRMFPALTMEEKIGTPVDLPPAIRAAALACGEALGLELYGVDFLVSGSEFHVVDVNAFPGYKGVLQAPRYLADYIFRHAAQTTPDRVWQWTQFVY